MDDRQPGWRTLYRHGAYRLESYLYPGTTKVNVRVERLYAFYQREADGGGTTGEWRHVRTWFAHLDPTPWWAPWRRRRELLPTIERAIALIDERVAEESAAEQAFNIVADPRLFDLEGLQRR